MSRTAVVTEGRTGTGRGALKAAPQAEPVLLMAVFLLGTNPVAVKYAVSAVPALPFVAFRFTVAGLLLLCAVRLFSGSGWGIGRRDLLALAGVGAVGVGMTNMLFTAGVSLTSASDTALLYAVVPVWGMILGSVLGLEKPSLRGILGVGIAFLGIGVVVYGGLGGSDSSLAGNLLVLGATVCWGSYTVLSLPLLERHSPLVVAAYTMLFGGLAALPVASSSIPSWEWNATSAGVWAAVAYSTVLVAAFGFFAWQRGASALGANKVLVYQYLITFVGVVSGVVLLGEGLGAGKVLGGAVVLLGVYLARRP